MKFRQAPYLFLALTLITTVYSNRKVQPELSSSAYGYGSVNPGLARVLEIIIRNSCDSTVHDALCRRLVEVSSRDFLLENALKVATAPERRASRAQQSDERHWLSKPEYGVIPQYLQVTQLLREGPC